VYSSKGRPAAKLIIIISGCCIYLLNRRIPFSFDQSLVSPDQDKKCRIAKMMGGGDDEFDMPNPFRSGGGGSADLLGPSPASAAQPPSQAQPYPMQQQQQQQPTAASPMFQQPDPHSGMVGSFNLPQSPPQQQQQQNPVYLSGQMDQTVNQGQRGGAGGAPGGGEIPSTPFGMWQRLMSCFRIEGYLPYFDVDTRQVGDRISAALLRFLQPDYFRTNVIGEEDSMNSNTNNSPIYRKGPDLYGPFWITMTLIFVIAATSNLSAYMHHLQKTRHSHGGNSSSNAAAGSMDTNGTSSVPTYPSSAKEEEVFEYDLRHLLRAGTVLSVFVWVVPSLLWLACTCMGMPNISWPLWVCVYGYSMTPYLLAALVAWVPISIIEWLFLALATAMSALLVIRNLSTPLLAQDGIQQAKAAPILMSILAMHGIFLLVLKFAFYGGW